MTKKKTVRTKAPKKTVAAKRSATRSTTRPHSASSGPTAHQNGAADAQAPTSRRLLPTGAELKSLYQRYTGGAKFDEHDKAFYFVLDVGGISRAKQLLAHVEEVLAELEEFQ